jgi:hypothetical protein
MGSSSKNKGRQQQRDPNAGRAPDAKMTRGPGFTGTNAYYSDPSMLPQAGGLVRPDALPGGIPGGIGLNYVKPPAPRQQLASLMRPRYGDWGTRGEIGSYRGGSSQSGEHASGGSGFW